MKALSLPLALSLALSPNLGSAIDAPLIELVDPLDPAERGLEEIGAGMIDALSETLTTIVSPGQRPARSGSLTLIEPLPQIVNWTFHNPGGGSEAEAGNHALALEAGHTQVLRYRGRNHYWSELDGEAGVEYRFTLHSTHRKTSRSVTANPGNALKEPMPADHPADTLILLRVSPLHASLTAIQLRPLVGGINSSHSPDAEADAMGQDPEDLPVLLRLGSRLTTVLEQRLGDVHLGMIVSVGAQLTPRNSRLEDPGFPHTEAIYMRIPLTALSRALDGATPEIRKDWLGRKRQLPPLQLTVRLLHRDRGAGLDSVLADRRMENAVLGSVQEIWEGVILLARKF